MGLAACAVLNDNAVETDIFHGDVRRHVLILVSLPGASFVYEESEETFKSILFRKVRFSEIGSP